MRSRAASDRHRCSTLFSPEGGCDVRNFAPDHESGNHFSVSAWRSYAPCSRAANVESTRPVNPTEAAFPAAPLLALSHPPKRSRCKGERAECHTPLRNYLQTRLGFSDADYAPIRESSQRLASELNALNQEAKSLRLSGSDSGQLELLLDDRETYIDNEVYALSNELSSQKKVTLEKFMAQFFAPKEVSIQIPQSSSATTGKAASK